jgi:hypothetical protein
MGLNLAAFSPGIVQMLKAFGFDPDEVLTLIKTIAEGIQSVNEKLAAIREEQDRAAVRAAEIERKLENAIDRYFDNDNDNFRRGGEQSAERGLFDPGGSNDDRRGTRGNDE